MDIRADLRDAAGAASRARKPARRRWAGAMAALGDAALYGVLAVSLAVLLAVGLVPHLGWYRTESVLSGSMRPYFAPGDLLVLSPEPLRKVRPGWVISYHAPLGDHRVQTHRVIEVVRGGDHPFVRTKGDANAAPDPWVAKLHGTTAWRVRAVIPRAGLAIRWLRNPISRDLTLYLAPFLLALAGIVRIWRKPGEPGDRDGAPEAPTGVVSA